MIAPSNPDPLFAANHALAFQKYRKPLSRIVARYAGIIEQELGNRMNIAALDIGCGVGHFTFPFARLLSRHHGRIDALDSSPAMLDLLASKIAESALSNIRLIRDDFLSFRADCRYSLFWLSDVLHLFERLDPVFSKIGAVADNSFLVAIRMSSHEQLTSYEWSRYFPDALDTDLRRHHDVAAVEACLRHHDFSSIEIQEIDETRLVPAKEYLRCFELKYLSSLRLLPESKYQVGMAALRAAVSRSAWVTRNARTTLILARYENRAAQEGSLCRL
jgi:SAM-dependent methyltransferase